MQTYHAFTHRRNHVLRFVLCYFPITPHVWRISLTAIELWFESFDGIFVAQIFAQVSSNFFLCALHLSTFNPISYFFYPVSQHLQVLLLLLIALNFVSPAGHVTSLLTPFPDHLWLCCTTHAPLVTTSAVKTDHLSSSHFSYLLTN